MVLFVFAIILLIAAIAMFIVGKVSSSYSEATFNLRPWALIPLGLALVLLALSGLRTVDAGAVGVPVTFGTVGQPIDAGVHFMAPWTGVENVNVRTVEYTMSQTIEEGQVKGDDSVEVKGKDGATGHVDSTTHFHVDSTKADALFRSVGNSYQDVIVRQDIRNCAHNAFNDTEMVVAATTARNDIQNSIDECIKADFEPRGIILEDFQLRNVRVEDSVQNAINAKVAAQQDAESRKFQLQAATQDAEKTRIQSQAVSDAQVIIRCGGHTVTNSDGTTSVLPNDPSSCQNQLTPEYLQWAYIDMMKSMVSSPNHDTVIIPAPEAGVQQPIINLPTK